MGHFIFSVARRVLEAAIVFLLIVYLPGLPPYMNFSSYIVTPPLPLEGTLSLNNRLNNAEHLYENKLSGPECFGHFNGELYTGVRGGEIVKIDKNGKVVPVAKFGKPCAGYWEEEICGRPLGLKFDKAGMLYVADAYYGIFKVDVKTGAVTTLVPRNVEIEGKVPMLPNSLDIASDGTVYWTDSSTDMALQDGVYLTLGDGSGRLLKYDPKKNASTVLINNLAFANGVVLSVKEDYVIVAETQKNRIQRYYLTGPKKGTADIFVDGLPGLPDNLKADGYGGYYVPLVIATDSENPVVTQIISPFPTLRKFLARLLTLVELPFKQVELIYPNNYTKRAIYWIGSYDSILLIAPKRVTILNLDVDGKIIDSQHSLDGSLSWISEFHVFNGAYYFGSPVNDYIGRVKMQEPARIPIHIKKPAQAPAE